MSFPSGGEARTCKHSDGYSQILLLWQMNTGNSYSMFSSHAFWEVGDACKTLSPLFWGCHLLLFEEPASSHPMNSCLCEVPHINGQNLLLYITLTFCMPGLCFLQYWIYAFLFTRV